MSEQKNVIRPNDRIPYPIEGATNKIMAEILSGEKLQDRKVRLYVKALEDALSNDGTVLVSSGSTTWIEMSLLEGFEFDPTPRSRTAPVLGFLGSEQKNDKN